MRKKGYTDQELRDGDLVGEKNGRIYDRFRNRLMFPIIDVRGNVIGFGGRVLDDSTPKYLNTSETIIFNKRKNLFGLNLAKKSKAGSLLLVEGNLDVVALHQYGFDNAIASLGTSLTEEQAALMGRYTDQVVLLYDGDNAGQNATQRAIPILERAGLQVKVLKMRDAKDPDEFLKKFGADRFKLLLNESSNRVEYQLNAIRMQYDLKVDEQRVKFLQEAANLIATLNSPVQQEIYAHRVADTGSISFEAMKIEIDKAFKRRKYREKKKQESIDLSPAKTLQPRSNALRYTNLKSAMAEEGLISMALRTPSLLDQTGALKAEMFSSALLGNVFSQLKQRHDSGLDVSLGVLEDLNPEEMSHITGIFQRQEGAANAQAFSDCVKTVLSEHQAAGVSSEDDLLAYQNKLRESKGIKK